jgi:hypothetical protein
MWSLPRFALAVAAVVLASSSAAPAEDETPSELRRLVTLSRHGSRAPNGIVARLCPANQKNLDAYHVPLEQLTEVGMAQLLAVGEHVRQVYGEQHKFLSPTLNGARHAHLETYFRSDAAVRCAQSAVALGFGLYPDGTGPPGFPREPVPVTMQLLKNEHDFAAPKGPCKAVFQADMAVYAKTRAPELLALANDTIAQVSQLCGVNLQDAPTMEGGEDMVLAVKDVADMFIFDRQQGLPPLQGLSADVSAQLETLAFTNLMERYYSTDRMITYWNGGFPDLLLSNLNAGAHPDEPSAHAYRYYSYHGHRELLHALGKMLGWDFKFQGLPEALNATSLHPGTTMFFELRARKNAAAPQGEDYFVETFVWSPATDREQVTLTKCSSPQCPLDEFAGIIKSHVARTGTWQEICNYHDAGAAPQQAAHLATGGPDATESETSDKWDNAYLIVLGVMIGAGLVFGVFNAVNRMRNFRRSEYRSL